MSVKLIVGVDWVIQPDYPRLSGSDGADTVTEEYIATAEGLAQNLPAYGASYQSSDAFFSRFSHLVLTGRDVTLSRGGKTYQVSLVWSSPDGGSESSDDVVKVEIERDTEDEQIPVSEHENYKYCWDHDLVCTTGNAGLTIHSGLTGATTGKMTDLDRSIYKWIGKGETVPEGYELAMAATKKATAFLWGKKVVSVTKKCANKRRLQQDADENDYTICAPPDTMGISSGEWLRGGSKIRKDGKLWVLSVIYINSKEIDGDLYD